MNEITVDILEHIGVVEQKKDGWTKEVNICSWCGNEPKVDIRDWDATHDRMSKGITLTKEQAKRVAELLAEYFKEA